MKSIRITIAAGVYQVHHRYAAVVAREKGFYEDEGIPEVDIIVTNHYDDNLVRELVAGTVHFGLDAKPQDVLRWNIVQGANVYLIGGYVNQFDMAMVGARGLTSVADLKHKRIGVSSGKSDSRVTLDAMQARFALMANGLNPDKDVSWVSGIHLHAVVGNPMDNVQRGEVDCAIIRDIDSPILEAQGFPILLRFRDFYPMGYPVRAIITSGDVINQNPKTVIAFIKAITRAYRFLRDMPRNLQYVVDLDKRMRAAESDPKEKMANIEITAEKFSRSPLPPDGRLPIEGLEVILKQEKEAGHIPNSVSIDSVARLEFVEIANKELNTRKELQEELSRVMKWYNMYGF